MNTKFLNTILCEVMFNSLPANQSTVKFSENQKISSADFNRKYEVYGLLTYDTNVMLKSPTNRPIVSDMKGIAITLLEGQTERHFLVPAQQFSTAFNGGRFYEFEPFTINYPNSYLQILDNSNINSGDSFCFLLVYRLKKNAR